MRFLPTCTMKKGLGMKRYTTYLASCAILAFGATAAHANCDELAALIGEDPAAASAGETGGGIEKDASTAPLETDAGASGGTSTMEMGDSATGATADTSSMDSGEGEVEKDASTAPLEEEAAVPESDGTPIAMSQADVEAQQEEATMEDGATGASSSDVASMDPEALERAREALTSGDDEACAAALEELQG